jgi:hypothetical protein
MTNGAYTLAALSAAGGLLLLMLSEPGSRSLYPSLGTTLLLVAVLLGGIGKGIEWLGHVRDGALNRDETEKQQ